MASISFLATSLNRFDVIEDDNLDRLTDPSVAKLKLRLVGPGECTAP